MVALDWAAFNVERAIGLRAATAPETILARRLTPELLAAIPDQVAVAMRVSDILKPRSFFTIRSATPAQLQPARRPGCSPPIVG